MTRLNAISSPPPVAAAPAVKSPAMKAPAPARPVPPVPPLPGRARFRARHLAALLSFLWLVALPVAGSGWYLWVRAADQYASEAGFAVRREEGGAAVEILGGITELSGSSSRDTDILYEYLHSPRLVAEIDAALDLRGRWSAPGTAWFSAGTDPVFALDPAASAEALHAHWPRKVQVSYDSLAGLIEIRVLAFDAASAQAIGEAIVARAGALINELSAVAQDDAIAHARAELEAAEARLRAARAEVTAFRNRHQLVDPSVDMQAQAGLLGNLQEQLAAALIELDLLREATRAGDPRLDRAEDRVGVIEDRIAAERAKLGLGGGGPGGGAAANGPAFAGLVGAYEALAAERGFAERAYGAARAGFELAQAEARRQSRYLAAWQHPTLPETPRYPQRGRILALVALFATLGWAVLVLAGYALRDRRG